MSFFTVKIKNGYIKKRVVRGYKKVASDKKCIKSV